MKSGNHSWVEMIEALERPVYYVVLLCFFVVVLVAEATHFAWHWLESARAILFPAVLLVVFRYFDRLVRSPEGIKEYGQELGRALRATLEPGSRVTQLDLLACTSVKYFVLLKDAGIHVQRMRLLLPADVALDQATFLSLELKRALQEEKARTLENWFALQREGRIVELEVVELPFVPMVHMMLINDTAALLGFFELLPAGAGMQTMDKFVARRASGTGSALIGDCSRLFEALVRCSSQRVATRLGVSQRSMSNLLEKELQPQPQELPADK